MGLSTEQINELKGIKIPWGEIGYIVYKRTYSRRLKDVGQDTEEYLDTVVRVVKACQKQLKVGFTNEEEYRLAELLLSLKGSVAGRFLWQLGTKTVDNLGLPSLQNCAVTLVNEPVRPFTWAMELLMLGCGVGYNIQKEYVYQIPKVRTEKLKIVRVDDKSSDFIVPDTREGWVKLLGKVLKAHFYTGVGFTYSCQLIRSEGEPIKSFGGTASGPGILSDGIDKINNLLNSRSGKKLRPIDCLDIMNIVASIVVAGNVRRSAQLAIGDWDDIEYLKAKRWDLGSIPNWRSNSNNSIVPPTNFKDLPQEFWQTYEQGEPYGLINLELSKKVGRLNEEQYPDPNVVCYNPCFAGSTQLLSSNGYVKIGDNVGNIDLVNYKGEIVSGKIWSNGIKNTIKVKFANKEEIICTPDHKFMLIDGQEEIASNLKGKRVMPFIDLCDATDEYVKYGFLQGDGVLGRLVSPSHKGLEVNIGKNDLDIATLFGIEYSKDQRSYYINGFNDILNELQFDSNQLICRSFPATFDDWKPNNKLSFLRGMFSANGSVIKSYRISYKAVSKSLILKLQSVLSEFNIDSYITTNKSKVVKFNNGDYVCRESYDLNIGKFESIKLFTKYISFVHEYKVKSLIELMITKSPIVRKVIDNSSIEVFDFSLNDDTHWGVVGSGFIAHNCAEQSLEDKETCCLADIFLPNITSKEELFEVATYLYRINKHSLALYCSIPETEAIVHKNMRMGIGITGILQCTDEQRGWLSDCYEYLREYDVQYSQDHGFPPSIKLTTVKPSGCRPWYGLVTTTTGVFTLEELFSNHIDGEQWSDFKDDIQVVQDESSNKISKTYINGNEMVWNVELEGQILLQSTANHPWYVTKNYDRTKTNRYTDINDWVSTDKLKVGDILTINLSVYDNEVSLKLPYVNMTQIRMRDNTYSITQPEEMNPDLAWLIGYLWGDGCLSESKYRIRFIDEHLYNLEKVQRILLSQFSIPSEIKSCNDRKASTIEVGSIQLYHWFNQQGIKKYFNNNIDLIPKCVRSSSKEDIIAFFSGFLDSDGCVSLDKLNPKHKKVHLSQKYSMFTRHIQDVALTVGLHFGHSFNTKGKSFAKEKAMIQLSLSTSTLLESANLLEKHSNKCKLMYPDLPIMSSGTSSAKKILGKVKKVYPFEHMDTFDVEIDNDHWFWAGAVKSHNTLSLLPGVTPGAHPSPAGPYYIRRVRMSADSNLVNVCRQSGYFIENVRGFDGKPDPTTVVVEFPCRVPDGTPIGDSLGAINHLEIVKWLQSNWSDNSVSCTIYYSKEELPEIKVWLENNFNDSVKTVSFLLYYGHGFDQAPYETISKERYDELIAKVRPIHSINVQEDDFDLQDCDNGSCPIK